MVRELVGFSRRSTERLEAEAVVALLAAVEDGALERVGSEYLDFGPATRICSSRPTIE